MGSPGIFSGFILVTHVITAIVIDIEIIDAFISNTSIGIRDWIESLN